MKKVWFVSHYSMPPKYEMRIKTQMYAHNLNKWGYETKIFSASTIHNTDINLIQDKSQFIERKYDDLDFIHIQCKNYSGNGLRRISNMLEFAHKFKRLACRYEIPDVIVADVNCINYKPIYDFCKAHNIRFYIDMRDLWPMSIVEYYKYSERNPIIQYLYSREKTMYERATGIIFSMEGGKEYIRDKGWENDIPPDKLYYINNGVDLDSFYSDIENNTVQDDDLDNDTFKVVYAGSVRIANNLKSVVDAAKIILDRGYTNIQFLIYGSGDDKEELEKFCLENQITNIKFKGFIEKKYIPYVLRKCDLSILNYKKAKTLKYGGSQNKLFEYMAAGKPVLLTIDMNYNIVTKNNCGITLETPTPESIADGIIKMYDLPEDTRVAMGARAKEAVKEYDFTELSKKLISIIEGQR